MEASYKQFDEGFFEITGIHVENNPEESDYDRRELAEEVIENTPYEIGEDGESHEEVINRVLDVNDSEEIDPVQADNEKDSYEFVILNRNSDYNAGEEENFIDHSIDIGKDQRESEEGESYSSDVENRVNEIEAEIE